MVLRIRDGYAPTPRWYRRGEARARILAYYSVLRQIRRRCPGLSAWRTRCGGCGVVFLADPRNRGRQDLRCPFGCREAHRQRKSTERSTAYYRTEAGREKKRKLNAKRRRGKEPAPEPVSLPEPAPFEAEIVDHLQMATSAIEERPVSRAEVVALLEEVGRQHRMVNAPSRREALLWRLENAPP